MPLIAVSLTINVPDEAVFRAELARSPWERRIRVVDPLPSVGAALVTGAIDDTLANDVGAVAWPFDATARETEEL